VPEPPPDAQREGTPPEAPAAQEPASAEQKEPATGDEAEGAAKGGFNAEGGFN
jgi:hypothetical protein